MGHRQFVGTGSSLLEEKLNDVPVAVTAFSGAELQRIGATTAPP